MSLDILYRKLKNPKTFTAKRKEYSAIVFNDKNETNFLVLL